MACALRDLGLRVRVASIQSAPAPPPALANLSLEWPQAGPREMAECENAWRGPGGMLRRRLARREGVEIAQIGGLLNLVERWRTRRLVGLGLHTPLLLDTVHQVSGIPSVWYAGDEPASYHLSCLRHEAPKAWSRRLTTAGYYLLKNRMFARRMTAAVGVSETEAKRLQRVCGVAHTLAVHNGVDLEYFRMSDRPALGRSLTFWGRMDFEPNIDAVRWFAKHVWQQLVRKAPGARWIIAGKHPATSVTALQQIQGIEVTGAVPNLRPLARDAAAIVLPMRIGGGV
jgi:hypothetical protein